MIGQKISHYRILSKLGEGGMGVVYRAEDLTLGRTVALKFLPPDSVAREEDRARLVHEARAAAALLHPNICPIHEIAEADGRTFISMAHIEGRSLKDRIAEGPMPLDEALSIARQTADALAAAHAKGIVHRDIKPANVMLTADGRPMLMDFGLAKVSGATKLTRTGTTMGTVAYMSPEQVQGREADHRSDIWALGVALYEMVSGRMPFGADYEAALLYSILNEDPEPLAVEGGDIPAGLDGIIAKALAKDPVRRYQKAEELVADLDALAKDREALPAGKAAPAKGLKRVWRRSRPWQRAAVIGALCIVAGALAFGIMKISSPGAESIDSIGILPLKNLTGDLSKDEMINGLEIVLSGALGSLEGVQIRSPQTMMEFKGSDLPMDKISRKVDARALITGSCIFSGNAVRLSIQVYEAAKDRQLYARTLSCDMQNLHQRLDEVAREVATALGVEMRAGSRASLAARRPVNPKAMQAYLLGMGYRSRTDVDSASKAIEYLERAVAIDSTFAEAYAGLAFAYSVYAWVDILPAEEAVPKAKLNIDRALALDPNLPEALGALADYKYSFEADSAAAEELFQRTFALDPNLAAFHNSYAFFLSMEGDCDKAVSEAKLAQMLDPLNTGYAGGVGIIFLDCFMMDSAIVYLTRAIAEDSAEVYSRLYRSSVYATRGRYREALRDVEIAAAVNENHRALLAAWYVNVGDTVQARKCFREVVALAPRGYWSPSTLAAASYWLGEGAHVESALAHEKVAGKKAFAYCCLGRITEAYTSLEIEYADRPRDLARRINTPWLVFLKRDPRYKGLLARAGIMEQ